MARRHREVMQRERKDENFSWKAVAWRKLVVRLVELVEQSEEGIVRR